MGAGDEGDDEVAPVSPAVAQTVPGGHQTLLLRGMDRPTPCRPHRRGRGNDTNRRLAAEPVYQVLGIGDTLDLGVCGLIAIAEATERLTRPAGVPSRPRTASGLGRADVAAVLKIEAAGVGDHCGPYAARTRGRDQPA